MRVRAAEVLPLVVLGVLARPPMCAAQWMPAWFEPLRAAAADSARVYPTSYWFEGATVGAAIGGTTAALWAIGLCVDSETRHSSCWRPIPAYAVAAALGGAIGAGIGGLVGGLFDAPRPRPLRGHAGRGALIGVAAGAAWAVVLQCVGPFDDCHNTGILVAWAIPHSAVGALAGWLIAH